MVQLKPGAGEIEVQNSCEAGKELVSSIGPGKPGTGAVGIEVYCFTALTHVLFADVFSQSS